VKPLGKGREFQVEVWGYERTKAHHGSCLAEVVPLTIAERPIRRKKILKKLMHRGGGSIRRKD